MSDNIILALVGLISGIGLEFTRQLMAKGQTKEVKTVDDITAFRKELLEENHRIREDRDHWQKEYYMEREARQKAEWQLEALEWIKSEHPDHTNLPGRDDKDDDATLPNTG